MEHNEKEVESDPLSIEERSRWKRFPRISTDNVLSSIKESIRGKRVAGTYHARADNLKTFERNPRTEYHGVEVLKAAMLDEGFDSAHPLIVNKDTSEVLSGNMRLLAAQSMQAAWKERTPIPVIYYVGLTQVEEDILAFEENKLRFSLLFSEECRVYVRLIDEDKLTLRDIEVLDRFGNVRGRKRSTVSEYYRCGRNLVLDALKAVDDGSMGIKMAFMLSLEDDFGTPAFSPDEQRKIVKDPMISGMSLRQFSDYLAQFLNMRDALRVDQDIKPAKTENGIKNLDEILKLSVRIARKRSVGFGNGGFVSREAKRLKDKNVEESELKEFLSTLNEVMDNIMLEMTKIEMSESAKNPAGGTDAPLLDSPTSADCALGAETVSPLPVHSEAPMQVTPSLSNKDKEVGQTGDDDCDIPVLPPARRVRSTVEREHLTEEKVAAC